MPPVLHDFSQISGRVEEEEVSPLIVTDLQRTILVHPEKKVIITLEN
jgi:hypothetical protein